MSETNEHRCNLERKLHEILERNQHADDRVQDLANFVEFVARIAQDEAVNLAKEAFEAAIVRASGKPPKECLKENSQ